MVLYTEFTYGSQFSEEKKEQSVSCLLKYKTNTKGKFFGTPYSFLASNQLAIASSPRHILICGIFMLQSELLYPCVSFCVSKKMFWPLLGKVGG